MKTIIISNIIRSTDAYSLAMMLSKDTELKIAERYNTNTKYNGNCTLKIEDVILALKNNAIFTCHTNVTNDNISGITMDEYYNSDILVMSIAELNSVNISPILDDSIIIWLDNNYKDSDMHERKETKYFMNHIQDYNILYFGPHDSIIEASNIIKDYLNSTYDHKLELLEENN